MENKKNDKKVINGWATYDLANSAFNLVISTAVFPPFFVAMAPESFFIFDASLKRDSVYSFSITVAYIIIAFFMPFLSGIADYSGRRKFFLKSFTFIGALGCIALFFYDSQDRSMFALLAYITATIGFGSSLVFYNSYLPEIATEDQHDKVSAKGFAYGYLGSVVLLISILLMIQYHAQLGFVSEQLPIRIGFLSVGVWWIAFAMIPFVRLPADVKLPLESKILFKGFNEVKQVGKKIWKQKVIVKFLTSYFFYIAGVNIVILLASIFAKVELNFGSSELIALILLLQLLAAIGSFLFAYISDKFGNKTSLIIQLVIWVIICLTSFFVVDKMLFYVISLFVGLVYGGIQSLSRSTYSKMIDDEDTPLTTYFSFYQVLTVLAIVMGTGLWGIVSELTDNLRFPVLATGGFFAIGLLILTATNLSDDRKSEIKII